MITKDDKGTKIDKARKQCSNLLHSVYCTPSPPEVVWKGNYGQMEQLKKEIICELNPKDKKC